MTGDGGDGVGERPGRDPVDEALLAWLAELLSEWRSPEDAAAYDGL